MSESALDFRLRPEADAISWELLSEYQREAFRRVLYMIDEAVESIGRTDPDGWSPRLIQPYRSSKAAFISGSRGAGKTSVMLSLMDAIITNKGIPYEGKRKKFQPALEKARGRVVWLEPIDLDPLPDPFSLVPSILDRVVQAIDRLHTDNKRPGSVVRDAFSHELLLRYQEVYREATLAWDSNVLERKSSLDPEYYADEIRRTNTARLSLSQRIDRLLEEISSEVLSALGLIDPLFIVTIDDFDLHPTASLDILRMLRMLSSPRLFFLMLGDVQILETMSDLGVSSEIGQLLSRDMPVEAIGIKPEQLAKLSGSISRNVLRKLLPAEQRVQLNLPSIPEGLLYCPSHERLFGSPNAPRALSILDLCENIPFLVDQRLVSEQFSICGEEVVSLLDYLFHPGFSVIKGHPLEKQSSSRLIRKPKGIKDAKSETRWTELYRYFGKTHSVFSNSRTLRLDGSTYTLDLSEEGVLMSRIEDYEERITKQFSWTNHLFATTPRRLADFWFALRRQAAWIKREASLESSSKLLDDTQIKDLFRQHESTLQKDLSRMCRDALLEETAFDPNERQKITAALTPSSIGDFNWSELPLRLVAVTEPPFVIGGGEWAGNRKRIKTDGPIRNLYHEIRACAVKDWSVIAKDAQQGPQTFSSSSEKIDATRELSRSTSALVMLLHDQLKLSSRNSQFDSNLIPNDDGSLDNSQFVKETCPDGRRQLVPDFWCKWVSTQYRGSYRNTRDLYWPAPSAMSTWAIDQFRRCWNEVLDTSIALNSPKHQCEVLAFGWISAGCSVIDGKKPVTLEVDALSPVPFDKWHDLHKRLDGIAKNHRTEELGDTEKRRCQKNWLENVVVMLMPEMGLPTHILFQLLFGINVRSLSLDAIKPGTNLVDWQMGNQLRALRYATDILHATGSQVDVGAKVLDTKPPHFKMLRKFQGNARELRTKIGAATQDANERIKRELCTCEFIRFVSENQTEIRSRRGVRLSLLEHIAKGKLTERLRLSSAIFLSNEEHSERGSEEEFGDGPWLGDGVENLGQGSEYLLEWRKLLGKNTHSAIDAIATTGRLFGGGGLVPHREEINHGPSIQENDEKREGI